MDQYFNLKVIIEYFVYQQSCLMLVILPIVYIFFIFKFNTGSFKQVKNSSQLYSSGASFSIIFRYYKIYFLIIINII